MVTLRIDEQTFALWSERAAACGLSVEDWLKTETAGRREFHDLERDNGPEAAPAASEDAWIAKLHAFAKRHQPTGTPLDDSRESIYD